MSHYLPQLTLYPYLYWILLFWFSWGPRRKINIPSLSPLLIFLTVPQVQERQGDSLRALNPKITWAASSEFVSSSIPSWQIVTADVQPFRGARDLVFCLKVPFDSLRVWASSGGSGTYRLSEQRRFRRACASAQSRQNLRCLLIQAVNQEEPSDGKPDPWPLWVAGHAQLKFVMTECSKTQIRLTGLK